MKLVFAHDHIFYKYNGKFYSTGGLSKEVLERYSNVFEEVVVVSRQKKIMSLNNKLTLASTRNVSFIEVPNFKSLSKLFLKKKASEIVKNEVENADCLIARTSSIADIAIKYAIKFNKPYLVEVVGCAWDALWHHSLVGKILAPFSYLKTKRTILKAPYVIYVTKKFLQERYPTKGKHTYCSNVALPSFDEKILQARMNKIETMNESKKIIGTIGAVNIKYKGQQYVIKALGQLKKDGCTNYEYQLVGGGDQTFLRTVAKKYDVEDHVVFLNTKPHHKVLDWLETIDIYIQPSKTEGLPRALIEAMSKALPAIGAKSGGIPELLDNGCIFTHSRNSVTNIVEILRFFDKKFMKVQAKRNYEESKNYDKNLIEERRKIFFEEFKKSVNNSYRR